MSPESTTENIFIRDFTRELRAQNAAVFAGAGLSVASGYVDWKGLLDEIITDLNLDPRIENDLVSIAQYHCNHTGSRSKLTTKILEHFSHTQTPTDNHRILSTLPIETYWTTNYDKLIEKSLENAKKTPDVKCKDSHLAITKPGRDVVVYKMHGDVDNPGEAILSKEDYEMYYHTHQTFISALRGDLVQKTFLFLGFSFTDPNIDYILSRVSGLFKKHQRQHFSIQRKVSQSSIEQLHEFKYRELKQTYFIKDLKRFGIQTVLVNEYSDITKILKRVADAYKQTSIFISGAAHIFGEWERTKAETFLHQLSYGLLKEGNKIVTGFGLGVGSPVINGALAYLNDHSKTVSEQYVVMRPFPQVSTNGTDLHEQWTRYRSGILEHAGIAIFVFGNKMNHLGINVNSDGLHQEFNLAIEKGLKVIPVGSTGFVAEELFRKVTESFDVYYPNAKQEFKSKFLALGDKNRSIDEIINDVIFLVKTINTH